MFGLSSQVRGVLLGTPFYFWVNRHAILYLQQFFTTYRERLRDMALRSLDNLFSA